MQARCSEILPRAIAQYAFKQSPKHEDGACLEFEATLMAPQQNAATVGTPKAMMPPVPEPNRACARHKCMLDSWHKLMRQVMYD